MDLTSSSPSGPSDQTTGTGASRPRWLDADMQDPWHRDLLCGMTASNTQTPADLRKWADSIAYHYSRSGTLEVTACVLALLDALDAKAEQVAP